MSLLAKLFFGLVGAELLDDAERFHDQHVLMRELRRNDSLIGQDALT